MWISGETDRQIKIYKQTVKTKWQADKQVNRQTNRQPKLRGQTDRQSGKQTEGQSVSRDTKVEADK